MIYRNKNRKSRRESNPSKVCWSSRKPPLMRQCSWFKDQMQIMHYYSSNINLMQTYWVLSLFNLKRHSKAADKWTLHHHLPLIVTLVTNTEVIQSTCNNDQCLCTSYVLIKVCMGWIHQCKGLKIIIMGFIIWSILWVLGDLFFSYASSTSIWGVSQRGSSTWKLHIKPKPGSF